MHSDSISESEVKALPDSTAFDILLPVQKPINAEADFKFGAPETRNQHQKKTVV